MKMPMPMRSPIQVVENKAGGNSSQVFLNFQQEGSESSKKDRWKILVFDLEETSKDVILLQIVDQRRG